MSDLRVCAAAQDPGTGTPLVFDVDFPVVHPAAPVTRDSGDLDGFPADSDPVAFTDVPSLHDACTSPRICASVLTRLDFHWPRMRSGPFAASGSRIPSTTD